MANKKKKSGNSNSYWMKYGGLPRKMNLGGLPPIDPVPSAGTTTDPTWGGVGNFSYIPDDIFGNFKSSTKRKLNSLNAADQEYLFNNFMSYSTSADAELGDDSGIMDAIGWFGDIDASPIKYIRDQAGFSKSEFRDVVHGAAATMGRRESVNLPLDNMATRFLINRAMKSKGLKQGGNPNYDHGGPHNFMPMNQYNNDIRNNPLEDPTFKTWFAKNARRPDVMKASGNTNALKQLFLAELDSPQMPLFSGELDDYGNIDKSGRPLDTSFKMLGLNSYGNYPEKGYEKKDLREDPYNLVPLKWQMNKQSRDWPGSTQGYKMGGTPRAESGYANYQTQLPDMSKAPTEGNIGTQLGAIGDTNLLQMAGPWGYVADTIFDIAGYKGKMDAAAVTRGRARDAAGDLAEIDPTLNPDANKDTLDLSTRLQTLDMMSRWEPEEVSFMKDLAPDLMQTAGGIMKGGMGKIGGGGGNIGGSGELMDNLGGMPDNIVRYGSNPNRRSQGGGGTQPYEAEGGEVIAHAPGQQPGTTGNLDEVSEGVSKLSGKSHEQADSEGQTGEMVDGTGEQYVFSKKLKSEEWNTNFAEAAEKIGKNIAKFEKLAQEGDDITKSTAGAMLEAWEQKLQSLQQEQETVRQEKFMEMVESGASEEELYENFPDLYEQFAAQQQMQGQGQQGMVDNPMGQMDMSQINPQDMAMMQGQGGQQQMPPMPQMQMAYGGSIPKAQNGFGKYDYDDLGFGEWFSGLEIPGMDEDSFLNYEGVGIPKRKDFFNSIMPNIADEGIFFNDAYHEPSKDFYKLLTDQYNTERNQFLTNANIPTSKPNKKDLKYNPANELIEGEEPSTTFNKDIYNTDMARYNLYNMNLPDNWASGYGMNAGLSKKQYFKAYENTLWSQEGMTKDRVNRLVSQEKLGYNEASDILNSMKEEDDFCPGCSEEEKAAKIIEEELAKAKSDAQINKILSGIGDNLLTLGPTLYNLGKSQEGAETEGPTQNEYRQQILDNLDKLTNYDIKDILADNEATFDKFKYLAQAHSDGSSSNYMNVLLKGMSQKQGMDLKAYAFKEEAERKGTQLANESMYAMGESQRAEEVRVREVNAKNRGAVQQFEAKFWEGISGKYQLDKKEQNLMKQDGMLLKLLDQIYPDVHKYMDKNTGLIDWDALIKKYPDMEEIILKYK